LCRTTGGCGYPVGRRFIFMNQASRRTVEKSNLTYNSHIHKISQNTIHIVHVSGQISNVRSDLMCESFMSFCVPIIFSILPSIAHSFYSQCAFSRRSGKYEISTIINSYIIYTRDMIYTYDMHCSYRPSQSPIQLTASK